MRPVVVLKGEVVDSPSRSSPRELESRLDELSPERRALLARLLEKKRRTPADGEPATVTPDPGARLEPFALTDLQQAYWLGRGGIFELGDVASHSYLEIEIESADIGRLEATLRRLIDHHDMLRAVVLESGRQRILESVPDYRIEVEDLSAAADGARERALAELRERRSHQVLPSDTWPLFDIRATLLPAGRVRLHVGLDALVFDGWSIHLFLTQWAALYHGDEIELAPLALSFRDYALAEAARRDSEPYRRARDYWIERLESLPPGPRLPLRVDPKAVERTRFRRLTRSVGAGAWGRVKERAAEHGLTPTVVLAAAYADVLALWSESPRFTLNLPQFNRPPVHPEVDRIIGECASFVLLEVDGPGQRPFAERARGVQQQLWRDLDHATFSGVDVLREMARVRELSSDRLMPVIFTGSAKGADGNDAYITPAARRLGDPVFAINQTSQVWLDNHVSEQDGALVCDWDWVEALFEEGMSEDMCDAFMRHLHRLADDETAWSEEWRDLARHLLPPDQIGLHEEINSVTAELPARRLEELFDERVREAPELLAIAAPSRSLTYGEVAELSHRQAAGLRRLGAGPDRRVAVVMEKGWEQIVSALAVLRTGAAYVPIDPLVPAERLRYLLENAGVELVLTQERLDGELGWPGSVRRLVVGRETWPEADGATAPPAGADDVACVIYTSGSTGDPKGVMVTHRNIAQTVVYTNRYHHVGPGDRALALTALHHDLSLYDIFGMLTAGAALVVPDAAQRRDPAHWSEIMHEHGVTLWNSVPAMMEMMLEQADDRPGSIPASLRLVILGGDWVPVSLPDRLRWHVPEVELLSIGGPTETTIWNIWYPVADVDPSWRSIPYGKPIANTRYWVMTGDLVERPRGVPGELCCSGMGVTRGYLGDPAKTSAKYVAHPRTGERLYRTGDMGRYLPDGNIEFLGRSDLQVKIDGQRIELGEIEAALLRHPDVKVAAVKVSRAAGGKCRLAAYVVPERGAEPGDDELRTLLESKLPPHMVPAGFTRLDRMPLTANGKLDRAALPDADVSEAPGASSAGARSELVAHVARLVGDVLKVERPDSDANLINLGANSLDMVRIGNRLENELGRRPRIDELFRLRTIRALAGYYDDAEAPGTSGPAPPSATGASGAVADIISSFEVLNDPEDREAFKKQQPGLRRGDAANPFVPLDAPVVDDDLIAAWLARHSVRRFLDEPVPFSAFSRLMSSLMQVRIGGVPKHRYGSAGGLYPVQVYLHVKPDRVEGVAAGTWYYRPDEHRLIQLVEDATIPADIHVPFINTPVFESAAFSVFLVTQLAAIAPSYGEHAMHFSTIEAGCMGHLLETVAPAAGIGLCHIGSVEFERIRHLFDLDDSHVLVHSMLGGLADPDEPIPWSNPPADGEDDEEEEGLI